MSDENEIDPQRIASTVIDKHSTDFPEKQEEPSEEIDQEETLYFWSEPGLCG